MSFYKLGEKQSTYPLHPVSRRYTEQQHSDRITLNIDFSYLTNLIRMREQAHTFFLVSSIMRFLLREFYARKIGIE